MTLAVFTLSGDRAGFSGWSSRYRNGVLVLRTLCLSTSMSSDAPASVPLPRQTANSGLPRGPPVWAIDTSAPSVQTPLPAKCARHTREGEICCQELKGDDERQLIDPDVVRDVYVSLLLGAIGGRNDFPTPLPRDVRHLLAFLRPPPFNRTKALISHVSLTASSVYRMVLLSPSPLPRVFRRSGSPSSSSSAALLSSLRAQFPWALVVS
jgi:hypothetical protein